MRGFGSELGNRFRRARLRGLLGQDLPPASDLDLVLDGFEFPPTPIVDGVIGVVVLRAADVLDGAAERGPGERELAKDGEAILLDEHRHERPFGEHPLSAIAASFSVRASTSDVAAFSVSRTSRSSSWNRW